VWRTPRRAGGRDNHVGPCREGLAWLGLGCGLPFRAGMNWAHRGRADTRRCALQIKSNVAPIQIGPGRRAGRRPPNRARRPVQFPISFPVLGSASRLAVSSSPHRHRRSHHAPVLAPHNGTATHLIILIPHPPLPPLPAPPSALPHAKYGAGINRPPSLPCCAPAHAMPRHI
jgi:hypothetical protein